MAVKGDNKRRFYKKKRYYIIILLILMIIHIQRSVNPDSKLPHEFKIKELKKEYHFSFYIYEYKVQNKKIDFENLSSFPIRCNNHIKKCNTFDWEIFEELDKETKKSIDGYLNDLKDNETIVKIDSLIKNEEIYFSGCYTLMKSNQVDTYRFWEYQFYLDINNRMLYVIDYTEDFLLPGIPNPF